MQIKNAKKWSGYTRRQAWGGTIALIFLAFIIRFLLQPVLAPYAVFHFFIVACLMIQYLYGYVFSSTAVIASILLGEYYFVKPYGSFDMPGSKDIIISLNFALVIGAAIFFMEKLQRSLYERDLILKVLDSRHRISLYSENERIFFAQKSSQAWAILEELLNDFEKILVIRYGNQEFKIEPALLRITQKWELLQDPQRWIETVIEEQRLSICEILERAKPKIGAPKSFNLTLLDGDNLAHTLEVEIDYFDFMGKPLSILRMV